MNDLYGIFYTLCDDLALGCVLKLDCKNWKQIPLIFFFLITQVNLDSIYI